MTSRSSTVRPPPPPEDPGTKIDSLRDGNARTGETLTTPREEEEEEEDRGQDTRLTLRFLEGPTDRRDMRRLELGQWRLANRLKTK